MMWTSKNRNKYKPGEKIDFDFFCLLPRTTEEGVTVWLETIIRRMTVMSDGETFFVTDVTADKPRYYLTPKQKQKLGIDW